MWQMVEYLKRETGESRNAKSKIPAILKNEY